MMWNANGIKYTFGENGYKVNNLSKVVANVIERKCFHV